MKKINIFLFLLLFFLSLVTFSCRIYLASPIFLSGRSTNTPEGEGGSSSSGSGGSSGSGQSTSGGSSSTSGTDSGSNPGSSGSDSGTGSGTSSGSDSGTGSGSDTGSGTSSGGTSNPSSGISGGSLNGYFVRPASGQSFSLTPAKNSEIWYMFTSTSSASKPSFNIKSTPESTSNSRKSDYLPLVLTQEEMLKIASENSSRALETKGITKSPSEDYVGKTVELYREGSSRREKVNATCRVKRRVNTAFGYRTLLIYEENNKSGQNWPSSNANYGMSGYTNVNEWEVIADYFLKAGNDNDIFDKVTSLMGNNWGYLNSDWLQENGYSSYANTYIPQDETISLFFCDVYGQGNVLSGIMGYQSSADTLAGRCNDRAMVYIHGFAAGGNQLGYAMTTLAHEFAHLVWDQYHSGNLRNAGVKCAYDNDNSTTEMFSVMIESYIARYLFEQKELYLMVDPFNVNNSDNPNMSDGYIAPLPSEGGSAVNCMNGGRGKYYVQLHENYDTNTWANDAENYGIIGSLGHYLLLNYGTKFLNAYKTINGDNLEGLSGVVAAINSAYPSSNMTIQKLLADWGTATMLSNVQGISSPYSVYKKGWFTINNCKVPSVNYWLYGNATSWSTFAWQGFQNSNAYSFSSNRNYMFKKKDTQSAGSTYSATAPTLPNGVALTVIAVPKENR